MLIDESGIAQTPMICLLSTKKFMEDSGYFVQGSSQIAQTYELPYKKTAKKSSIEL